MNRRAFGGLLASAMLVPPVHASPTTTTRWSRYGDNLTLWVTHPEAAVLHTRGGCVDLHDQAFLDGVRHRLHRATARTIPTERDVPAGVETKAGVYRIEPAPPDFPRVEGFASFWVGGTPVRAWLNEPPGPANLKAFARAQGDRVEFVVVNEGPDVQWVESGFGAVSTTLVVDGQPLESPTQRRPRVIRTSWTPLPVGETVIGARRVTMDGLEAASLTGTVKLPILGGEATTLDL